MSWVEVKAHCGSNKIYFDPFSPPKMASDEAADDKSEKKSEESNAATDESAQSVVIYFGGDVQSSTHDMELLGTYRDFGHYCLENVSQILRQKFANSHIIIVKSNSFNGMTALFSNFLINLDDLGQSKPSSMDGIACLQINSILSKLAIDPKLPLQIVGFSRGVNVLTQLVYECNSYFKHCDSVESLLARLQSLYFLDGGNGALKKTVPMSEDNIAFIYKFMSERKRTLQWGLFGTAYQWNDRFRPWIGEEMDTFHSTLKKYHDQNCFNLSYELIDDKELNQSITSHIGEEKKYLTSLNRHFEIVRTFRVLKNVVSK